MAVEQDFANNLFQPMEETFENIRGIYLDGSTTTERQKALRNPYAYCKWPNEKSSGLYSPLLFDANPSNLRRSCNGRRGSGGG